MQTRHGLTQHSFHSANAVHFMSALAVALFIAGCGDAKRELSTTERMQAVQQRQETQPDFYVPRKSVDYMADLNELRDNKSQEKSQTIAAQNKSISEVPNLTSTTTVRARSAADSTAATTSPPNLPVPPVLTATPATALAAISAAKEAAIALPVIAQDKQAPSAITSIAADVQIAAAANQVRVIRSARPNFPREASQRGIQRGDVRARATINAVGDVTDVAIISANPVGIFNREVISAMQRWKFNAGANNRSFETDIAFQP